MAILVAHRAGNDLKRLHEAEALGIAHIEADVRLWRGRLEVRHLKTLGPIPVLWDRWRLAKTSRVTVVEQFALVPGARMRDLAQFHAAK